MGFSVFAAGDSYNDLGMIHKADRGALFRAPESITKENPQVPAVTEYKDFTQLIHDFLK